MNLPSRSARASAEAERLREVFADAAYDVTPSAVPLGAIEREGRRRRLRRRTAALVAVCGAVLVPLAVAGLRDAPASGPDGSVNPAATATTGPSPSPSKAGGRLRTVAPDERVRVGAGIEIRLSEDGEHWTEPGSAEQFRSVVDGSLDMSVPGVSLRISDQEDGRSLLSGIFHGPGRPARAEVAIGAVRIDATVLSLRGDPGWGVWYALPRLPDTPTSSDARPPWTITVYDSTGGVLARREYRP
ncbi:hypothetical protein AB0F07_34760 [Streptomyces fructofermentans]|uniref:hypothetical protein n=1 Tax=Streptomyces fructofermentans TaxID=152141 RepID=UPI0033D9C0DA